MCLNEEKKDMTTEGPVAGGVGGVLGGAGDCQVSGDERLSRRIRSFSFVCRLVDFHTPIKKCYRQYRTENPIDKHCRGHSSVHYAFMDCRVIRWK